MKRILLLLAALTIAATSSAQVVIQSTSVDSITAECLAGNINIAGGDLKSAGNSLLGAVCFTSASVVSAIIHSNQSGKGSYSHDGKYIPSDLEGITEFATYILAGGAVICLINAALNLRSAGKALQNIHPIPGGISIDIN